MHTYLFTDVDVRLRVQEWPHPVLSWISCAQMNFLQCLFWAPLKWNMKLDTYEAIFQNFLFWNNNRLTGSCRESRQAPAYSSARLPHLGNAGHNVNARKWTWVQLRSSVPFLHRSHPNSGEPGRSFPTGISLPSCSALLPPPPSIPGGLETVPHLDNLVISRMSYGMRPFDTGFVYSAKCPGGPSKCCVYQ